MLRHRRRAMPDAEMRLLYSVRSAEDVIYGDELGADASHGFVESAPAAAMHAGFGLESIRTERFAPTG